MPLINIKTIFKIKSLKVYKVYSPSNKHYINRLMYNPKIFTNLLVSIYAIFIYKYCNPTPNLYYIYRNL